MLEHVAAALFAILAWWLSTGAILFAAGRQSPRKALLLTAATALAILGLAAIHAGARMEGTGGVYLGFLGALAVWAWHEASFLAGVVTGPNRADCPPGARGLPRFRAAFAAIRDHELAILATALLVLALSWSGPNQTGLWTFTLLWLMRISAKLLLFLGAPHVNLAMLPPRLSYLATYFRTERLSAAFPLFLGASVLAFLLLCHRAATAPEPYQAVAATMLASFAALAVLEHVLLVVPFSDAALWRWAMPRRDEENAGPAAQPAARDKTKLELTGAQGNGGARKRHPVAAA